MSRIFGRPLHVCIYMYICTHVHIDIYVFICTCTIYMFIYSVCKHRASVTTGMAVTLQTIISIVFYVVFYECSRESHSPSYLNYYLHNVAINISPVVLEEYNSFKFNTTIVITYG
jgi:hypothetical protein